jgi:hypothetical protein
VCYAIYLLHNELKNMEILVLKLVRMMVIVMMDDDDNDDEHLLSRTV